LAQLTNAKYSGGLVIGSADQCKIFWRLGHWLS